jgi:hypothetical protein
VDIRITSIGKLKRQADQGLGLANRLFSKGCGGGGVSHVGRIA